MCYVKALLHAIRKGLLDIVRAIIDHPNYLSQETQQPKTDVVFQADEKHQYSPDITPLMLAAHMYVSSLTETSHAIVCLNQCGLRHHCQFSAVDRRPSFLLGLTAVLTRNAISALTVVYL